MSPTYNDEASARKAGKAMLISGHVTGTSALGWSRLMTMALGQTATNRPPRANVLARNGGAVTASHAQLDGLADLYQG